MKLAVIGGTGLSALEGMKITGERVVRTPFGEPSGPFIEGTIGGLDAVFLARHGKGHHLLPGELNHRANIFALKTLGVTHILSISAVGSLREDYAPRDVVIVDQYFDRTRQTYKHTFFGNGIVGHITFANPVCPELSALACGCAKEAVAELKSGHIPKVHEKGTYICMEGPAFSTAAASKIYQSWGLDVIGMTNIGEAKLAREAEICYATVAMVTDYDSWRVNASDNVTINMVVENLTANVSLAKRIIEKVAAKLGTLPRKCECPHALENAIITDRAVIPEKVRSRLEPIIGKYL